MTIYCSQCGSPDYQGHYMGCPETAPKPGTWEWKCEHANEVPNVCPCPPTCGCRWYSCKRTDKKPGQWDSSGAVYLIGTQAQRDAKFLRYYAAMVACGQERTIDIPSVLAMVLKGIAERIIGGDLDSI